MSARHTFIVTDDHPMVRRGLVDTLQDHEDFVCVGVGKSAGDAVRLACLLEPQFALLDVNMPGGGVEAAELIRSNSPAVKIIMYSFREERDVVQRSFQAGASGYIVKGSPSKILVSGIRSVLAGNNFIDPKLQAT